MLLPRNINQKHRALDPVYPYSCKRRRRIVQKKNRRFILWHQSSHGSVQAVRLGGSLGQEEMWGCATVLSAGLGLEGCRPVVGLEYTRAYRSKRIVALDLERLCEGGKGGGRMRTAGRQQLSDTEMRGECQFASRHRGWTVVSRVRRRS